MYSFISGKVAYVDDDAVVIDCGGVGYEIKTTTKTLEKAASVSDMLLYTVLNVREDEMTLYGFESQRDKKMYLKLTSISGVGPKAALAILSEMDCSQVASAVISDNQKAFSKVNGIGPKTAGRIVLELKDKIDYQDALGASSQQGSVQPDFDIAQKEAVEALERLGYSKFDAVNAVKNVSSLADTAEDMILMALKNLAM